VSAQLGLEQRYRRALRLLPGYYRDKWEEDMVAAFLDSWMTGDPEVDGCVLEFCKPGWPETASVAGLAARLYLGGTGAPRRYFAWGQAVRRAVLVMMLFHAVAALDAFVRLGWTHSQLGWLPASPANVPIAPWGGIWPAMLYGIYGAWIVVFLLLVIGHYRTAGAFATLALALDLVMLLRAQVTGASPLFGSWAHWILLDLAPVLAMAAFYRGAPPIARRPWLLAWPASYLLVFAPLLAVQATGNFGWLPDTSGLCCVLVSLACLARVPRAWSRHGADSGVWSLTLTLLAAVAGGYRIVSLGDYLNDPHLIYVGLAELLILAVAVALVAPDAAHAQTATPAPPRHPHPRPA
jgi:hypothetical protein